MPIWTALIFFFSSRRRHTRSLCDWSSDVCSSDLGHQDNEGSPEEVARNDASPRPVICDHELTTHIHRKVDAEITKSNHPEERDIRPRKGVPVGGIVEVHCGWVPIDQPHDAGEEYQERSE